MKKIVSLLSAVTIFTSSTVAPISAGVHINSVAKAKANTPYPPSSFKNIIKNENLGIDMAKLEKDENAIKIIDEYTNKFYETYFKKDGQLVSLTSTPQDDVVVQTFSNTFTNNSPNSQLFRTQEYSKEITNTHSFSVSLSEKISLRTSFRIPFISKTEMTIDLSSEQKWSESTATTEKIVNPSQEMIVSPYSVGKVKYVIRQGTYHTNGVLRFNSDMREKVEIPEFWYNSNGKLELYSVKVASIFEVIVRILGYYPEYLDLENAHKSIFSYDYDRIIFYFNLPISWDSQGGSLDVIMDEEPL